MAQSIDSSLFIIQRTSQVFHLQGCFFVSKTLTTVSLSFSSVFWQQLQYLNLNVFVKIKKKNKTVSFWLEWEMKSLAMLARLRQRTSNLKPQASTSTSTSAAAAATASADCLMITRKSKIKWKSVTTGIFWLLLLPFFRFWDEIKMYFLT